MKMENQYKTKIMYEADKGTNPSGASNVITIYTKHNPSFFNKDKDKYFDKNGRELPGMPKMEDGVVYSFKPYNELTKNHQRRNPNRSLINALLA